MPWLILRLFLLLAAFLGRDRLALENIALRQQLAVFKHHAQQIRSQLLLLGHGLGLTTVKRCMRRGRQRGRGEIWMTFFENHVSVTAACDVFTVPTAMLRNLHAFVVLSHVRRLILHVAVTLHPTAEWTARQLTEASPIEEPQSLLRDRDRIYGNAFTRQVEAMGIQDTPLGFRQPWMNCLVERAIGTLQRECTDRVIVLGGLHHRDRAVA